MKVASLVAVVGLCAACASSSTPNVAPTPGMQHRSGQITRAELDAQHGRKLGSVIRAIDAGMLANRGEPMQVWVDGSAYGVDYLDRLEADDVQQVAKVSALDARQMFGDRANGAALVIRTRSR